VSVTDWIADRAGQDARLRRIADCLSIAAANLVQDRLRFAIAVVGTAVPILLLLLQMALLAGVRTEVTRLYNDFDFDIALVPVTYEYMFSTGVFDSVRLAQAQAVAGVADTFALNVEGGAWTGPAEKRSPLIVIGIDDKPGFIRDPEIRDGLASLGTGADVLVDRYSSGNFGPLAPGTNAFLDDHPVTVAGHFSLGMFFYADGAAIVRNVFLPPLSGASSRDVHVGLIRTDPGASPAGVKAALIAALPADVQVLTRDELIGGEQDFFLSTKPLGIMVTVGMVVAFLAGIVVLWQVLSAEIMRRLNEFATLSAMGFGTRFVLGVGFCETFLLGLAAFLPAMLIGAIILQALQWATHLPAAATPGLVLKVLGIVLVMCGFCAASVGRRIARAQPANLF
jgi:putative ABC transport system permease protein